MKMERLKKKKKKKKRSDTVGINVSCNDTLLVQK